MLYEYKGKWPVISERAFIADNASIIGEVEIGADSSVWFGAVIRGDEAPIKIGCGTNVQDNVVLHCDKGSDMDIGDNVTIGHGSIVHGAVIGSNTLIGMGAIVLDGARIGPGCIIGAGAVVKERAEIPAGSLVVGVPGKVVREVRPEQAEALRAQSYYVPLSKDYMEAYK